LGVNKRAIVNCDPLLFYQLILPLGDPRKNKLLEGEVRDPYYSEVEWYTAKYTSGISLGGSYSHLFSIPKIDELLKFDMILTRDGRLGGSRGSIHLRWDKDDSLYCERITTSMTHIRFLQLKRTWKLNDYDYDKNNEDPAKKFDLIFKTSCKISPSNHGCPRKEQWPESVHTRIVQLPKYRTNKHQLHQCTK
jgi:hypothetical protein